MKKDNIKRKPLGPGYGSREVQGKYRRRHNKALIAKAAEEKIEYLRLRQELHSRFCCPQESGDPSSWGSSPFHGRHHPTFQVVRTVKEFSLDTSLERYWENTCIDITKLRKKKKGERKKTKLEMNKMNLSQTKRTGSKSTNSSICFAWTSLVNSVILGDSVHSHWILIS